MPSAGLDFGTSNSAIGVAAPDRTGLAPVEGTQTLIPSAIFFETGDAQGIHYGRAAIEAYVLGMEGRLMRGLKSILSTGLIDERTQVGTRRFALADAVGMFIRRMKAKAEEASGTPIDCVVHGRPVHFVDGDADADARAQGKLEGLAHAAGFSHVSFTYEPLAAAYQYERMANREELVLVADLGGGTADFSIVRIGPQRAEKPDRKDDILAHAGLRVGGTDFDRLLSMAAVMPHLGLGTQLINKHLPVPIGPYADLSFWPTINLIYTPKARREIRELLDDAAEPQKLQRLLRVAEQQLGHRIAFAVEETKIALTSLDDAAVNLGLVEAGLEAPISRARFDDLIQGELVRLRVAVWSCLADAGVEAGDIDTVFLTGGSSLVPAVAHAILSEVPEAQVRRGDDFLSVALGLTLEAQRRYG